MKSNNNENKHAEPQSQVDDARYEGLYFPHFATARTNRKIKRLLRRYGPSGYGRYFMLLEMIVACSSYVYALFDEDWEIIVDELQFADVEEARVFVQTCVQWDLLQSDDNLSALHCRGLVRRMAARDKTRERLQRAGQASAQRRKEAREREGAWRDALPKWFDMFVASFRSHYPKHDRAFVNDPMLDKALFEACSVEDAVSQDTAKAITRGLKRYEAHYQQLSDDERRYHQVAAVNWVLKRGWENSYDV